MKSSYKWGWQISDKFQALTSDNLTKGEADKKQYVQRYLDPSVREAKCGWDAIGYCVGDINGEYRREYVLMFADKNDSPRGARWIDVTGNSKGAIAETVWSLVFA